MMDALQACNGDTSNAWIDVVGGLSPIRKLLLRQQPAMDRATGGRQPGDGHLVSYETRRSDPIPSLGFLGPGFLGPDETYPRQDRLLCSVVCFTHGVLFVCPPPFPPPFLPRHSFVRHRSQRVIYKSVEASVCSEKNKKCLHVSAFLSLRRGASLQTGGIVAGSGSPLRFIEKTRRHNKLWACWFNASALTRDRLFGDGIGTGKLLITLMLYVKTIMS